MRSRMEKLKIFIFLLNVSLIYGYALPAENDMVVVTEATTVISADKENNDVVSPPKITEFSVDSNVTNRFAKTVVKSKVKNPATKAQETTFFVVIPDQAYISGFVMEIAGKNYTAYVQEKEEAKKTYDQAVASGIGAAHVSVSARDSNKFTVSTNIEPEGKATFYLTYEELLDRKDGFYELVINIHPKQLVKDLNVKVNIEESKPLTFVKTPAVRSGNEISKESDNLNPKANIQQDKNTAVVKFNPDYEQQKKIATGLGTKEEEGLAGQFIVQYDVERDPSGGEVLLKDGYFVHFFSPSDLVPLVKHIVFVLDTSGSMYDRKMEQLKIAMKNILGELNPKDYFNLVEFNTNVKVWNLDAPSESTKFPGEDTWYVSDTVHDLSNVSFPPAYPVNNNTLKKANKAVADMYATGGTNIFEALRVGIHLVKQRQTRTGDKNIQPLILFLTDGDPTVGKTIPSAIISGVAEENAVSIPIISLSFGDGADRNFLKKLSLNNFGFARHIYEDSDASLQLENFYREISSPLLHNVKFSYTNDTTSLTETNFPILYKGDEIVVAGAYKGKEFDGADEAIMVSCLGVHGPITLKPVVKKSVGQLERLWAYMTVKKYLAAKEKAENVTEYGQKALELSLKYSFVTPVTSLVVVKPNETSSVDAEAADKKGYETDYRFAALPAPGAGSVSYDPAGPMGFGGAAPPSLSAPALGLNYASYGPAGAGFASISTPVSFQVDSDVILPESEILESAAEQTTELVVPVTLPPDFQAKLPWLQASLRPDGSLGFFKGQYTLGLNETSPTDLECTDPQSQEGLCKLVKDCETLHPKLTGPQIFKDYFCIINDSFAGVCCPKTKH